MNARITRRTAPALAVVAPLVLLAGSFGPITPSAMAAPPAKHLNAAERHPTLTGAAAGVATHHVLKKRAAYKKAHHQKLNFAERHPTITGIGAAVTTHHVLKKSAAHKK